MMPTLSSQQKKQVCLTKVKRLISQLGQKGSRMSRVSSPITAEKVRILRDKLGVRSQVNKSEILAEMHASQQSKKTKYQQNVRQNQQISLSYYEIKVKQGRGYSERGAGSRGGSVGRNWNDNQNLAKDKQQLIRITGRDGTDKNDYNNKLNQNSNKNLNQEDIIQYCKMTSINQPLTSKNSSTKRSFVKDSIESKNMFSKARVSNQSLGNNSQINIKSSNSAVRKAQFSLERKTSQMNQGQNLRVNASSQLDNAHLSFSNNRKSDSKKGINTLTNRIEELTQGFSNRNVKHPNQYQADSATIALSQSSRDQKSVPSMANIKNQHLRKYIESREREKRAHDITKGGGTSATRTSGVRYNDLSMKSPGKTSKYGQATRKQVQEKCYTGKKAAALDQSMNSLNSGKGAGANNLSLQDQVKAPQRPNADIEDQQSIVVEDMHHENSYDNLSPFKNKAQNVDSTQNLATFNVHNLAAKTPMGFHKKVAHQKVVSDKKNPQATQNQKNNILKQGVKSERSEHRYKNQYLARSGAQKEKNDDEGSNYYGHSVPSSRLFNSKSPSKKSIQLQQILKQINLLSSSRPAAQNAKKNVTTQSALDFKNSTSKSSSLIRNFINQVNSNVNANNPHTHTKSIQAMKPNKEPIPNLGSQPTRFGTDMKEAENTINQDSAPTPQRGNSNRYRHVNPYIQTKNRQSSMITGKTINTDGNNSISRNHISQDANSLVPRNDDAGLLTNQSVSPVVNSPLNSKNELPPGELHALLENKLLKNKSFLNKNESVKSTSLEKRHHHSGVTAHTFSSSLKQKIDKKNQQTIMQKQQGRSKVSKVYEQMTSQKNMIITDKSSMERVPQSLATDRSDRMQTNRRKKTERAVPDKIDTKLVDSLTQKSKRDPTSGTAKKIKQATNAAKNHPAVQKGMKISRPITSDMTSKQTIHSPSKGDAYSKNNGGQIKFNNNYISYTKRLSIKEPSSSGVNLVSTSIHNMDQNPQKFGQGMKGSEVVNMKEARLETSAAQFDTNELMESPEQKDASGEHMIEQPMENIDEVSMAISHIKTPKKVSDMKSGKPAGVSKTAKKKSQKLIQSETKYQYGKNSTALSSKKEPKPMGASPSNENFNDLKAQDYPEKADIKEQNINLGTKYLTQAKIERSSDIQRNLYDQNPYNDNLPHSQSVVVEDDGKTGNLFIENTQEIHIIDEKVKNISHPDNATANDDNKQPQDSENEQEKNVKLPADIFYIKDQAKPTAPSFKKKQYKYQKSRSQQVAEEYSDSSDQQSAMDYKAFLSLYKDRMLDEEIEELGEGKNQFSTIYYAGAIPLRTREDLQGLKNGKNYRIRAFNLKKEEAKKDYNNGEFQGNPVFDNIEGYYKVEIGSHIAYRYEVMKILGKGSFAQVVQCRDHKSPTKETFAVKITRNTEMDHKFAHKEAQYLRYIMQEDPHDKHNIVRMVDQTYFREHHCFVFELLHTDLFEHLKATGFVGFSPDKIRDYAVQILKGLVFLEKHKIIHCDLKPENILCADSVCRNLKIVDFGSGCFRDEQIYTYVQSRFYRSPEVILRIKYTEKVDIWSLGCILAELYTGEPLFPGNNEQEQLELIMELCGMPPESMIDLSRKKAHYFDTDYSPYLIEDEELGILRIPNSRMLKEAVPCDDAQFLDFIMSCIEIDPVSRFSASEAMEHPWIKSALSERQSDSTMRSGNGNKRMGQNESDEQLWQPQILRDREFREREGQEMIAEQSPERDVIVQRKAPKGPKGQVIKIQNVNETVTTSGATGTKHRQNKKSQPLIQNQKEIKVIDFIAKQKGKNQDSIIAQGYEIDLHNQQSQSFLDSESRDERSSQISLVTDMDINRKIMGETNSTVLIHGGFTGLLNQQSSKYGQSGVSAQPRKSILPHMDYTNKYVNRHQQSRKESTDKEGSHRKQNNYSILSSQKSFQGHGSTFNRGGDNQSNDDNAFSVGGKQLDSKALSQMEQISYFENDHE